MGSNKDSMKGSKGFLRKMKVMDGLEKWDDSK